MALRVIEPKLMLPRVPAETLRRERPRRMLDDGGAASLTRPQRDGLLLRGATIKNGAHYGCLHMAALGTLSVASGPVLGVCGVAHRGPLLRDASGGHAGG